MDKSTLIALAADEYPNIAKGDVEKVINAALKIISKKLVRGEKVRLVGFGTFKVRTQSPHEKLNPRTGEKVNMPETRGVVFKSAVNLKRALNK